MSRKIFRPSTTFILITYAVLACVWIIGGDILLGRLAENMEQLQRWQTPKGIGFAVMSAAVLLWFGLQRDRNELSSRVHSAALAAAPHGIVITDLEGRIEWVNPAFTETTGYGLAEVLGADAGVIESGLRQDPQRRESFLQALAAGEQWSEETLGRRKDGTVYPEELTVAPVRNAAGEIIRLVAIKQDVTQKKDASVELQRRAEQQQLLAKLSHAALVDTGLTEIMQQAVEAVADALSADYVNVLRLDADQDIFGLWAASGWEDGVVGVFSVANTPDTQAGYVLRSADPVISTDLAEDTRFTPPRILVEHGVKSNVGVAIDYGKDSYGILSVHDRTRREFTPTEVAFLQSVANSLAAAIRQQNYARQIIASNELLRAAYDATIEGWAQTLDLRDHETEGHSRRVADLSVRLGEAVGLDEDELLLLRRGALLHDIGKMGVPDSILHKPGALTSDEWRVMQSHTILAKNLLSRVSFLQDAVDVPYSHHEKWDGSGYPQGLKGEEIPLAARIFAVVDVYDALSSDRPYREAWDENRILKHIRDESGRHFDPVVAEKFLELMAGSQRP